ncbi:exonuclease domain-containing protein [Alteribacillus sp. HJP-4]|uniref:exonuclease domain-containing protein n=1 Tax=Alteribacillus sp. HJP-4 TaxID=2775394 RepID=UPI0035CD0E1E
MSNKDDFHRIQEEIENFELSISSKIDVQRIISLSEIVLNELPEYLQQCNTEPKSIPFRHLLIQAYASIDEFEKAREATEKFYEAGAYHKELKSAVLKRIDEMQRASIRLHTYAERESEINYERIIQQLGNLDTKALQWYVDNSLTLPGTGVNTINAAFVDVETTGMSPDKDEIVEIGVMLCRVHKSSGKILEVLEEANELNEPSFSIPANVIRVHGITDEDVAGKKMDTAKFDQLFSSADLIIAHNVSFDRGFIERCFPSTKTTPWHCSVQGVRWKSYGFPTRKLLYLCKAHKIAQSQNHRALDDVKLTVELLQRKNPAGEYYLKELIKKPYQKKSYRSPRRRRWS